MEHIKQNFSIKDLENLSGIKAHTIRIWEKRYNVLEPERTDTNIRTYDGENLQKLLNIAFLNSHGYKISRISKMENMEIQNMVGRISASSSVESRAKNDFKLAMMNFDEKLFHTTYNKLEKAKTFREIFHDIFIPLLNEVGILWQTDTIKPIHEHYIVELIKEKVYLNIEKVKSNTEKFVADPLYVLFLPNNEIHDIGILYLNYEILASGKKAIYLGPSLPLNNIHYLTKTHNNIVFMSYLTISPNGNKVEDFIEDFQKEVCAVEPYKLYLFGQKTKDLDVQKQPRNIKVFDSPKLFLNSL
ncbi:MerR family transcriptional regulator [Gramella sp. AN32]|uniref:MerR family transcriptional regulator n=1 Tax=Christiangramia antarctica TaxID=2058158 RepID=A0ABW5X2Y5_9FLAO|nr:MerR family transcriptional regulator [Gramella sp. AN32]MCM4157646.1 MerR family transcriptional regulator [Gramella sp. AN32]